MLMRDFCIRSLIGVCVLAGWIQSTSAQDKGLGWVKADPKPSWIWDAKGASDGQQIYLQHTFTISRDIQSALVYTTCDNSMTLWINGHEIGTSPDWPMPIREEVSTKLVKGVNTISVQAKNDGGPAAFVFKLQVRLQDNSKLHVLSDPSWKMSNVDPGKDWFANSSVSATWTAKLKTVDTLGAEPWGIPDGNRRNNGSALIAADDITVPDGFAVDLVHTVDKNTQGSWVALANGPHGKLIASDQDGEALFWIEVQESAAGPTAKVSRLELNEPNSDRRLSGAQGLLWAFDALWVHKNGGHLFRVTDSNGDGVLDLVETVPSATGGGEHGNHAVIQTADGQGIYMVGGNHAPLGELAKSRVTSWQEDLVVPRMWDANGHARGVMAPGGWVTRLNPQTFEQELICIGFRNEYDIALNRFGDLFTYDADMEWDLGAPWYRPTRICHVVSGGDYGWRSGTGKWMPYYEDSLPAVVDIGPGSPTGVVAGTGAKFPAKYQDVIYALDWTFGTIYAIHLTPQGAGYVGTSEPFATGSPLPVTDATVGNDGALYFAVGGRGAQSGLYRIRYVGTESTAPSLTELPASARVARQQREQLEAFHGQKLQGAEAQNAIDTAWPYLESEDRFLRAAARVAIESQPVELWATRALEETKIQSAITAAVALARSGNESHQADLVSKLSKLPLADCLESQLLGALRAISLTGLRLGYPNEEQKANLIQLLDPLLPNKSDNVNTELVNVLSYLQSPTVVTKAIDLIVNRPPPQVPDWSELASRNAGYGGTVQSVLDNHPPSREIGYAMALRSVRSGWSIDQRRAFFQFLNEAGKKSGGASYPGFLRNIRDEALGFCTDAERVALQDLTGENYDPVPDFPIKPIVGPGREWSVDEAKSKANRFREADFENGRSLYFATGCGKCHRYAGLGGSIGPDLTSIPNKFDMGYVVEHVIEPSRVISDQYQSSSVLTTAGQVYTGLVSQADGKVAIYPADVKADPITLTPDDIESIKPSPVSQMPKGLVDGLNADELRDLIAYLMSGGDPQNRKVYGK
jgi:putative heme-binding domain-containing protein